MSQHQIFQFPVVTPAPVISRQKRPSNFNLRFLRGVTVKPSGPDDLLVLPIDNDKGPAGFHRLSEEDFEHIFFIAITLRMLLPDERVGRDGKKIVPILRLERAQLDEFAF